MTRATDKELLIKYSEEEFAKFKLSDDASADIPIPSIPFFGWDDTFDTYEKTSNDSLFPAVKQIKKNGDTVGFVWHTTAEKIQEAVRWGVIPVESLVGKVVGALGRYRLIAHNRIMNGMISNSHVLKIKLLDHFQKRCELLKSLELFVNHHVPKIETKEKLASLKAKLTPILENYIIQLRDLRDTLNTQFENTSIDEIRKKSLKDIFDLIQRHLTEADEYKKKIESARSSRSFFRASGQHSIFSFIKNQLRDNVNQLQGLNQGVSFSTNRWFALTRGEMDGCCVEAEAVINGYNPDLRNSVTSKHQGVPGNPGDNICSDFSLLNLSSEEERNALVAIANIEGYVKVDLSDLNQPKLRSISKENEEVILLQTIYATNWQLSPTWTIFFTRLLDLVKDFFVSVVWWTRPSVYGVSKVIEKLYEYAKANDPFWYKVYKTAKIGWLTFRDIFKNIGDALWNLIIEELPNDIRNDYRSTFPISDEKGVPKEDETVLKEAEEQMKAIQADERSRLKTILKDNYDGFDLDAKEEKEKQCYEKEHACDVIYASSILDANALENFSKSVSANAAYVRSGKQLFYINKKNHLYQTIPFSAEQQPFFDDIFKTFNLKLDESKRLDANELFSIALITRHAQPKDRYFAQVDYHLTPGEQNDILTSLARGLSEFVNVISKNLYAKDPFAGAAYSAAYIFSFMVVLMPQLAAQIGPAGAYLQALSKSWGSDKISGGVAVAATVAPVTAGVVNAAIHGPKSWLAQVMESICRDPASNATSIVFAWLVGYLIANGFYGVDIGVISKMAREDLGENPDVGYVFIVAKLYILISEALHRDENDPFKSMPLEIDSRLLTIKSIKHEKEIKKFGLIVWLSQHQADIPKLSPNTLFDLERIIRKLFPKHADSLCRILYPAEQHPIAYQFFAIPLASVLAIVRLFFSLFVSLFAWSKEHADWHMPMKRALSDLFKQSGRDLVRLVVFAKELISGVYVFVTTPIKMIANIIQLTLSRITNLFGVDISLSFYVAASRINNAIDWLGQVLNPGRLLKSVQVAHPNHTVRMIESTSSRSYNKLMTRLSIHKDAEKEVSDVMKSNSRRNIFADSFASSGSGNSSLFTNSSVSGSGSSRSTPRSEKLSESESTPSSRRSSPGHSRSSPHSSMELSPDAHRMGMSLNTTAT